MQEIKRPTKKQYELLDFIEKFVAEKGYGPSYREIMAGCNYKSVATVALHVDNLIKKGLLNKKDRSARSLEVIKQSEAAPKVRSNQISPSDEKWLVEQIEYHFLGAENSQPDTDDIDGLQILIGALKILGLDGAANSFTPRLNELKKRL